MKTKKCYKEGNNTPTCTCGLRNSLSKEIFDDLIQQYGNTDAIRLEIVSVMSALMRDKDGFIADIDNQHYLLTLLYRLFTPEDILI